MAHHRFEGEIENITEAQFDFINKVIEKEGFKDSKVTFEAVGGAADNFGANVKRIIIESENGNLSIFAKIAPTVETARKVSNVAFAFANEHLMYTGVLLKFLQLQKEANIPEEDLLKFPKWYGTYLEAPNEVILIEDLKTSGFAIMDRFVSLSDECVTSVLKNLAIYHSLSYVLRIKEPDTYNYYKDNLRDMMAAMAEGTYDKLAFFQQIEKLALNYLDDPEHQNILRKNEPGKIIEQTVEMMKYENDSQYTVIAHGDCWTNNIMFKFEGEDVKQSMLIDYQQSKNYSPVHDLLYLIFNCTDHEMRVKNYYDWIDYYHEELEKSLANYGLKVDDVYSRSQLDADLKRYGKLAFGTAVFIAGLLSMKPEEASKFKEALGNGELDDFFGEMGEFHADTTSHMKKKLVGMIESFTTFWPAVK